MGWWDVRLGAVPPAAQVGVDREEAVADHEAAAGRGGELDVEEGEVLIDGHAGGATGEVPFAAGGHRVFLHARRVARWCSVRGKSKSDIPVR